MLTKVIESAMWTDSHSPNWNEKQLLLVEKINCEPFVAKFMATGIMFV